jgi:nucleotide-binding universal stress UspA family protein
MIPIRQILYATDLSAASTAAWDEAQRLARLSQAELVLLHVVPPFAFPPEGYFPASVYQEMVDAAHGEAHETLGRLLERQVDPWLKVRTRIEEGPAATRILDVAGEEKVDLIVMGTHGRSGLPRLVLGSVADRVVRQATCPVLTARVRPEAAPVATAAIRRILYATDFSPTARAAWPWAVALAEASGADVDLLHVTMAAVPDRQMPPEMLGRLAVSLRKHGVDTAERFLAQSTLPRERVHVLIGRGAVAEQIVHWARARSADLIVMGTQGWSGLLRWMLGSVAHQLVQVAPCPVLTIGPTARGGDPT